MISWSFIKNDEKFSCKLTTVAPYKLFSSLQVKEKSSASSGLSFPDINFTLFDFLAEQFPDHLDQFYLVVYNEDEPVAFSAIQLVDFKFFEYVNESLIRSGGSFSNLVKRLLYRPGQVFDGKILVLGHLLLSGIQSSWMSEDFSKQTKEGWWPGLMESVAENAFDGLNNFTALAIISNGEELQNPAFGSTSFWQYFEIYPVMSLEIDPEWMFFDDYFKNLRSRYKKKLRLVLDKSSSLEIRELSVLEVEQKQKRLMSLFRTVLDSSSYNLLEPGPEFFGELMKMDQLEYHLSGIFDGDEMIAFYSWFNYNGVTEGHYLGYEKSLLRKYDLYKLMLINLVDKAIENKSHRLVLGRTATIVKADLGAIPLPSRVVLRPVGTFRRKLLPLYYRFFFRKNSIRNRKVFH